MIGNLRRLILAYFVRTNKMAIISNVYGRMTRYRKYFFRRFKKVKTMIVSAVVLEKTWKKIGLLYLQNKISFFSVLYVWQKV
jgi:hypothetical protein